MILKRLHMVVIKEQVSWLYIVQERTYLTYPYRNSEIEINSNAGLQCFVHVCSICSCVVKKSTLQPCGFGYNPIAQHFGQVSFTTALDWPKSMSEFGRQTVKIHHTHLFVKPATNWQLVLVCLHLYNLVIWQKKKKDQCNKSQT